NSRNTPSNTLAVIEGPHPILTNPRISVSENPKPGENHRDSVLVGSGYDLLVANRPAGLNHCRYAAFRGSVDSVPEGEECVGREHRSLQRMLVVAGLYHGVPRRIDAAHLARADSDRHAVARQQN